MLLLNVDALTQNTDDVEIFQSKVNTWIDIEKQMLQCFCKMLIDALTQINGKYCKVLKKTDGMTWKN